MRGVLRGRIKARTGCRVLYVCTCAAPPDAHRQRLRTRWRGERDPRVRDWAQREGLRDLGRLAAATGSAVAGHRGGAGDSDDEASAASTGDGGEAGVAGRGGGVDFPDDPLPGFRDADHKFEWSRAEFQAWAHAAVQAAGGGYDVSFATAGAPWGASREQLQDVGGSTQAALFVRRGEGPAPSAARDAAPMAEAMRALESAASSSGGSAYRGMGRGSDAAGAGLAGANGGESHGPNGPQQQLKAVWHQYGTWEGLY